MAARKKLKNFPVFTGCAIFGVRAIQFLISLPILLFTGFFLICSGVFFVEVATTPARQAYQDVRAKLDVYEQEIAAILQEHELSYTVSEEESVTPLGDTEFVRALLYAKTFTIPLDQQKQLQVVLYTEGETKRKSTSLNQLQSAKLFRPEFKLSMTDKKSYDSFSDTRQIVVDYPYLAEIYHYLRGDDRFKLQDLQQKIDASYRSPTDSDYYVIEEHVTLPGASLDLLNSSDFFYWVSEYQESYRVSFKVSDWICAKLR